MSSFFQKEISRQIRPARHREHSDAIHGDCDEDRARLGGALDPRGVAPHQNEKSPRAERAVTAGKRRCEGRRLGKTNSFHERLARRSLAATGRTRTRSGHSRPIPWTCAFDKPIVDPCRSDTIMDVGAWLRGLGLGQYEASFRESEIDAEVLPELTDGDLEKIGVPLGHRKRLLNAIANLRAAEAPAKSTIPPSTASSRDVA